MVCIDSRGPRASAVGPDVVEVGDIYPDRIYSPYANECIAPVDYGGGNEWPTSHNG